MKKILYISLIALLFAGCDDRLDDLNTDKRNPAVVDPSSLFTQGVRETFDMMASINVNDNPFNLYAQYWAQTTYPDESQYDMTGRSIPANFWTNGYRDALIDYKEAKRILKEELSSGTSSNSDAVLQNRIATLNIMSAYVYTILVDTFGDIPYTEALDPDNLNPKYDDARTVYTAVLDSLDNAMANIEMEEGGFPAGQDPLYGGDMENWMKFANSWKLRLGMMLADVDKSGSVSIVNEALSAPLFLSNDDNASLTYLGSSPNTNPVYEDLVLSGRADFVAANTVIDIMNDIDDPRRSVYFRGNLGDGTYNGGTYGDANNYSGFTQVGDILHTPDFPGTILNYAEVEFLMAEAAARGGYSITLTADSLYRAGIKASFGQWGLSDSEYDTYIGQSGVSYSSAPGDWKQKIGVQLWLALYNQGFEGWTTWRKFDFTGFNAPPEMKLESVPLRFTYPLEEAQLNGPNYNAAGSAIGGDLAKTHLFWDVN